MAKGRLKKFRSRQTWNRSPVQKPHSTKKGKKGYKRNKGEEIVFLEEIMVDKY